MKNQKVIYNYWVCDKCSAEFKMPQGHAPMKDMKCPCGGNYKNYYGEQNEKTN